jgi:hypothetical protein
MKGLILVINKLVNNYVNNEGPNPGNQLVINHVHNEGSNI